MTIPAKNSAVVLLLILLTASLAMAADQHKESTFDIVVEQYLVIQSALSGDTLDGVSNSAATIAEAVAILTADFDARQAGVETKASAQVISLLPDLERAAVVLSNAKSIKKARAAFGDLSDAVIEYRNLADGDVPHIAYCGMAKKSWLQTGKTIANPYYGASMLRCGSIVKN